MARVQARARGARVLDLGSTGTESACSLHRVLACLCACLLACALTHSLCCLLPCLLVSVSVLFERLRASSLVDMLVCVLACVIAHSLALLRLERCGRGRSQRPQRKTELGISKECPWGSKDLRGRDHRPQRKTELRIFEESPCASEDSGLHFMWKYIIIHDNT